MSIKANYVKGERYFYVHSATLACFHMGLPMTDIRIKTKDPKVKGFPYHRVRLEIVRTKKEAAAVRAKFRKMRKKNAARAKAEVSS